MFHQAVSMHLLSDAMHKVWHPDHDSRTPDAEDTFQLFYLPKLEKETLPHSFQPHTSGQRYARTKTTQDSSLLAFYGRQWELNTAFGEAARLIELSGLQTYLDDYHPELGQTEIGITFSESAGTALSAGWLVRVQVLCRHASRFSPQSGDAFKTCSTGWKFTPVVQGLGSLFVVFVQA